jgi:hypothetical protein
MEIFLYVCFAHPNNTFTKKKKNISSSTAATAEWQT